MRIEELYKIFLKNKKVSTDSRVIEQGSLFFALKGDSFDGNKFAESAINAGADYAIIDNKQFAGKNTILVDNVLDTLQQLANLHRRQFKIPVLAITGSNGKTTTKELTNAVLCQHYKVTSTKGNLNNHIGVPLTLLEMTSETEIAIIEMGANHQGEIAELCKIAEPTHGLITNIGKAHLGGFGGYEGVIKAKTEMYNWLQNSNGTAFVNSGNQLLMEHTSSVKRVLYGSNEADFTKGNQHPNTQMLVVDWLSGDAIKTIETGLVGNYNFENVMAAICLGSFFNVPESKICSAISNYIPSNSRSQWMQTERNKIILDAYNANPTSMLAAIENFIQLKAMHKMVILGDMLELGDKSFEEHKSIVQLIEDSALESIVLVGPTFMEVAYNIFTCFSTSDEAYNWLLTQKIENFTILIKGSRGIKMEKVIEAL